MTFKRLHRTIALLRTGGTGLFHDSEVFFMIKTILLSTLIIFIVAFLYALSNKLVGREDHAHGCGLDNSCDQCAVKHKADAAKPAGCDIPETHDKS